MLKVFESFRRVVHYKGRGVQIDNLAFKLHYRATFAVLVVCVIIVSAQQFIGEHIHCLAEDQKNIRVINSFCFFSYTFTIPGGENLPEEGQAHPGVRSYVPGRDPVRHHAYYQWVPIFLFLQAMVFYAPHYIWKAMEGGRLRQLVRYLEHSYLAVIDKHVEVNGVDIPSRSERTHKLDMVRDTFLLRAHSAAGWGRCLVFCEVINAIFLACQIAATHRFVGPYSELAFPLVTKCNFRKYGPSGSIQLYDAMCVLPMNVVNDKIFRFLWYWYIFVAAVTVASLVWRVATYMFHATSVRFNQAAFGLVHPHLAHVWSLVSLTRERHFSDWLFLYYLAKNLDPLVFQELFLNTAAAMQD